MWGVKSWHRAISVWEARDLPLVWIRPRCPWIVKWDLGDPSLLLQVSISGSMHRSLDFVAFALVPCETRTRYCSALTLIVLMFWFYLVLSFQKVVEVLKSVLCCLA